MKNIEEGKGYRFLRILKSDAFRNLKMNKKVRQEYFCKIKKILKSKLNSGNAVTATN